MESVHEVLERLLRDQYCLVHVNTKCTGVVLPDHLKANPTVTLKLSYYFVGGLHIDEKQISTELRFGGVPYQCVIPNDAVWGATSEGGYHITWDTNAPNPLFAMMLKKDQKEELAVVKTAASPAPKQAAKPSSTEAKERPSFLKRIK